MKHILMNTDIPVLIFDLDEYELTVLNNDFLPYECKDYIIDTNKCDLKTANKMMTVFRDYLASRTLNLSRDNAKTILNVAALPQTLKTDDRLKIVMACRGLTMTDNFWIKKENEDYSFNDVNLRKRKLSNVSYDIAILGKHISATREELIPDLTTTGMFSKYWSRKADGLYLYKTDKTDEFICTKAELKACEIIENTEVSCVHYEPEIKDNILFAVSKCITNDDTSLITMSSYRDYCTHVGINILDFLENTFMTNFANMCVIDYCLANTDRHFENFGLLIDNKTNNVKDFAPLFDHNQSLIADEFETNIDELIYEPTGKTFSESIKTYARYSTIDLSDIDIPTRCKERYNTIEAIRKNIDIDIINANNNGLDPTDNYDDGFDPADDD